MVSLLGAASNALLCVLLAAMAASCDPHLIALHFRKVRGIACGLGAHYLIMPVLGFLATTTAPLSLETRITLLLVTVAPSGGFSGLWCSVGNADLALSVAVTTASTLVSALLRAGRRGFEVTST